MSICYNTVLFCFNLLQQLMREISPHMTMERSSYIDISIKVLITLWTLGNQESFRQIGDRL